MNMGAKSGLGRGLQQAGQQILDAALAKRGLDLDREKFEHDKSFGREKFEREQLRKHRELLARIGWRRGENDHVGGGKLPAVPAPHKPVTSSMKTWDPKAMAHKNRFLASQYGWRMGLNDTQSATSGIAGGIAKPTGRTMPAMTPRIEPVVPGADLLRRPDEEGYA